jgi:hypothetical protein
MAKVYGIQKSTTINGGFTADHWAVGAISLAPAQQKAFIVFHLWKDFASRLSGASQVPGKMVIVEMTFAEIGLGAAMENPLDEMANAVIDYALLNAEDLSGGQKVSQSI